MQRVFSRASLIRLLPSRTRFLSNSYPSFASKLDIDARIAKHLETEVAVEKKSLQNPRVIKNWAFQKHGSLVTLVKNFEDEKITVKFDLHNNLNVPDDSEENPDSCGIISFPDVSIQIAKNQGSMIEVKIKYDGEDDTYDEEVDDQTSETMKPEPSDHTLTEIKLFQNSASKDPIYVLNCDVADEEFVELFENALKERGINDEFYTQLLDLSTTLEHELYVSFLDGVKNFFNKK